MKKRNFLLVMLLGSMLSFQACDNDDDDSMDRQYFVTQASSGNMLEIQAGAMAVQKAQNAQVKAYGQHMVTDHTQAGTELSTIAQSKSLTVSTSLTALHQQQLNILTPLTGTAFDKAFMALMVQSHNEQVQLFDDASRRLTDVELKSFAAVKLPVLETHLQEATQLNATVNP